MNNRYNVNVWYLKFVIIFFFFFVEFEKFNVEERCEVENYLLEINVII